MSFSDNHSRHLQGVPLALQEGTVQYNKLKGVIQCIVDELSENGFPPQLLRDVIRAEVNGPGDSQELQEDVKTDHPNPECTELERGALRRPTVAYELTSISGQFFPRLRVWTSSRPDISNVVGGLRSSLGDRESKSDWMVIPPFLRPAVIGISFPMAIGKTGKIDKLRHEQSGTLGLNSDLSKGQLSELPVATTEADEVEFIVPLVQDGKFFTMLAHNLEDISSQLKKLYSIFSETVADLAKTIQDICHPASVAANFHPYSRVSTHPASVEVKVKRLKSDLYAWRDIFQLYAESKLFESSSEGALCEWSLDECERRLMSFVEKASRRWLPKPKKTKGRLLVKRHMKSKFQYKGTAEALEAFVKLNLLVFEIKKFSFVNAEAIADLLRTRTECCALPTPFPLKARSSVTPSPLAVALHAPFQHSSFLIIDSLTPSIIKPFLHSMDTTLFPVIPALEDYVCAICMCIAFKPIRLSCSHFFCVRCLVKMQRRGEGNCPMCRAPNVLEANATNVDWALLNFMEDWFPRESREKLKANEKEIAAEMSLQWESQDVPCRVS